MAALALMSAATIVPFVISVVVIVLRVAREPSPETSVEAMPRRVLV
jgi:hypothetical protein